MDFTEIIIPDETAKGILSIHLKRYEFARGRCEGRQVLDLGCGVGYGSAYLAEQAWRVTGVDRDSDSIRYALSRYHRRNTKYIVADSEELSFRDRSFDVVCCFEAIEHVREPGRTLREVARILKEDGLFFVSTPWVPRSKNQSDNPHHYQEWSHPDFRNFLLNYFSFVQMSWQIRKQTQAHRWLQKLDVFNWRTRWIPLPVAKVIARTTRTAPFAELELEDIEVLPDFSENPLSQIGVCSGLK